MNQYQEMELCELIRKHLESNPIRGVAYIKILDNKVIVTEDIRDLDQLSRWPTGELK